MNDIKLTEIDHEFAKELLLGATNTQPSYGLDYLDAFPDYVDDIQSHYQEIEKLFELLTRNDIDISVLKSILILGTGHGTHEKAFTSYGLNVFGLDICLESLIYARQRSIEENLNAKHILADFTFSLPLVYDYFDFVVNIGTSFGFDPDDRINYNILRNAFLHLRNNGYFVFDAVNIQGILKYKQSYSTHKLKTGNQRSEEFAYDPISNSSLTKITVSGPNRKTTVFQHFTKYYTLNQISKMLERAGFGVIKSYGDFDGNEYIEKESTQIVVLAKKS